MVGVGFRFEGRDEGWDNERYFRDLLCFKVQGAIEGRAIFFNRREDLRE